MTAVMKYIIDQNKDGNGISIAYYLRRRTEQSISFITWQFIKKQIYNTICKTTQMATKTK